MIRRRSTVALAVWLVLLAAGTVRAEPWTQWRGPHFNGSSTETDLPTRFSTTENVTWTATLPGAGASTPIVWGDRVFITAQVAHNKALWALCLDRRDGSVRWSKPMGQGFANKQGNTGASPSAITDGKTVWFYFGNGELAAFDLEGNETWRRNISEDHGPFDLLWDYGATGLLYGGRLYIPVIHGVLRTGPGEKSFLLCVDPATGKDLWKQPRPSDAAREAKQAYTTPIPTEIGGRTVILVGGGDYTTAHDAATGKEVWRTPSYNPLPDPNFRTIVSPAVSKGIVTVCAPRGGRRIYGAPLGRSGTWAWTQKTDAPDVCTPLVWQDDFYVLVGTHKRMLRLRPTTGETVWEGNLGTRGRFQASPTGADGKIYCLSMNGEAVVLSAGEPFEVLHRTDMGGKGVRASIAVADGQLFIRTDAKVYCIGRRR